MIPRPTLTGLMTSSLIKSLASTLATMTAQQKILNIKFTGSQIQLLPGNTEISLPDWAINDIKTQIYNFLWNNKRPLLTRDLLSLPLSEGGLNIPRIATKIQALRINTVRRLLDAEQAHRKYFTSHFPRLSNMDTGKHTLCLSYTIQQIDRTIPTFHKELLTYWLRHSDYHIHTYPPVTLPDILQEPIFHNPLVHNPGFQFQWTD